MLTKDYLVAVATEQPVIMLQSRIMKLTERTIDDFIVTRFSQGSHVACIKFQDIYPIVQTTTGNDPLLTPSFLSEWVINGMSRYAESSELNVLGNISTASPYELRIDLHDVRRAINGMRF